MSLSSDEDEGDEDEDDEDEDDEDDEEKAFSPRFSSSCCSSDATSAAAAAAAAGAAAAATSLPPPSSSCFSSEEDANSKSARCAASTPCLESRPLLCHLLPPSFLSSPSTEGHHEGGRGWSVKTWLGLTGRSRCVNFFAVIVAVASFSPPLPPPLFAVSFFFFILSSSLSLVRFRASARARLTSSRAFLRLS